MCTHSLNIRNRTKTVRFMLVRHFCSYRDNHVINIPIGGKVPDVDHAFEDDVQWTKGRAVSTLHHTGERRCTSP